ncbi:MAG: ABC-type amino acid transport substrate-binding protein, partial [Alteromonadaceae bacterium]
GMLIKYLNHKFSTKAEQLPKSVYIVPSTQQRQLHLAFSNSTEIQTVERFRTALNKLQKNGTVKQIFTTFEQQWTEKINK